MVEVGAGEISDAGQPVFVRRRVVGVPVDAVHAGAEDLVQHVFHLTGRALPERADGGGRLRGEEAPAIDVGGAGSERHLHAVRFIDPVGGGPRPGLAHRDVVDAQRAQPVHRRLVRAGGFHVQGDAPAVGEIPQQLVVFLRGEVADGQAEILQETIRQHAVADDVSGKHRQPRADVVATPLFERLLEAVRPIAHAHLPAIDVQEFEAVAIALGDVDQALRHVVPLRGDAVLVERVVAQAAAVAGAGVVVAFAGGGHAVADHRPLALRRVPHQLAVLEAVRQVDHALRGDGQFAAVAGKFEIEVPHVVIVFVEAIAACFKGLDAPVPDGHVTGFPRHLRDCLHRDVLIENLIGGRHRQFQFHPARAAGIGCRGNDLLEAVVVGDVRVAGTWAIRPSHSSLMNTGPCGLQSLPLSQRIAPPMPWDFIASRSRVIDSRVARPACQNHQARINASCGGLVKPALRDA